MAAKVYAVIDTNVLVSALLAKREDSAPVLIYEHLLEKNIIPLYNESIIAEYGDVLRHPKFKFDNEVVQEMLSAVIEFGISMEAVHTSESFPNPKDIVLYEVALSKEGSYLVTDNIKHFPKTPVIAGGQRQKGTGYLSMNEKKLGNF